MLDATKVPARNVISLAAVRQERARPLHARLCRHCGAALGEGENEDECSGADFSAVAMPTRRRAE